jgi:uncharacterized protein with FMN-binding domain
MRTRAAFLAGAGSAAIIAIGWQAGAGAIASQSTKTATPQASGAATPAVLNGTFHGQDIAEPQFGGDVQVDVVFTNGKITDVVAVSCNATAGRDQACPMLRQEAISAQSAKISAIGQATYTSNVYMQSMQTALDAAGYKG